MGELVEGVAEGCRLAGCVLLGGETAEHPGMMEPDEFDIAGFCVGVCERRQLVSGARIKAGDTILGLPSSGPHSNGFSLVRKLLERAGTGLDDTPPELAGSTVADALLEPTAIYARAIGELTRTVDVRGMAHITGGGIPGNLARQFPAGLGAEIDTGTWERQPVFGWLASLGVENDEMWRVFNMGLGFACVVVPESVEVALTALERGGTPGLRGRQGDRGRGSDPALRVGVLISGEGTNLQALIDAPDIDVACVVSSRPEAPGVGRAERAGIPVTATTDASQTADFLDEHGAELVVLAGYMRILPAAFLDRFPGRIVNVHPVAAPRLPGQDRDRRCAGPRRARDRRHRARRRRAGGQRADPQAGGRRGSV